VVSAGPRTIVVFSDIACPWAHICIHRLHTTRARLGFAGRVSFEPHAFPLEIINEEPTPKRTLEAEIPVAGGLEPEAGWQIWGRATYEWPTSMLPALEAVQAARAQGTGAAEALDRALRIAFFRDSRVVAMRHEILDIAAGCDGVDTAKLKEALDDGRARRAVIEDKAASDEAAVEGSPHLFLPDGTDVHNPGIELHWVGEHGAGFPVVDKDDPSIYEELLERAASH